MRALVISLFIIIGLFRPTLDEAEWLKNGQIFLSALSSFNFLGMYVGLDSLHPAVTVMWVGGLAQILPSLYLIRLIFLITITGLLYLALHYWKRLCKNQWFGLGFLYFLFTPTCALFIGVSWLDMFLVLLVPLTLMTWIDFLQNNNQKSVYLAGLFLGLAGLTKYLAFSTFILMIFLLLIYRSTNYLALAKVGVVAAGVFTILYPTILLNPYLVLFSRFSAEAGYQTIQILPSQNFFSPFFMKLRELDPVLIIGAPLLVWDLKKDGLKLNQTGLLALAGLGYLLTTIIIVVLLKDPGRGPNAFLNGFHRYLAPSIVLMAPYTLMKIWQIKNSRLIFKISLWLVLGVWEAITLFQIIS